MVDLLSENIELTKDIGVVQDQSLKGQYGLRKGQVVVEWSVAAEMKRQGVSALAIGTYQIKDPNGDNIVIPEGSILTKLMLRDDTVAKVGSGTITPAIQDLDGDWEAMDNAVSSVATYVDDNGASNSFVAGAKFTVDAGIRVAVAGDTVTAGAFTLFIDYVQGIYT